MKKKNGQSWKSWLTLAVVIALCLFGIIIVFVYFGILATITLIAVLASMMFCQKKEGCGRCKYV